MRRGDPRKKAPEARQAFLAGQPASWLSAKRLSEVIGGGEGSKLRGLFAVGILGLMGCWDVQREFREGVKGLGFYG